MTLKMDKLLIDILHNPTGPSIDKIEELLGTEEGEKEFLSLLLNENRMAFTYMKMKVKEWIAKPERIKMINLNKDFFYSQVFKASDQNFLCLCTFFEILYLNDAAWDDIVEFLAGDGTSRCIQALNSIFNKYRVIQRSDKLYTEIINNILLCKDIFIKGYIEGLSKDKNLIQMFFSLVCQDIHPFFEDNAESFMKAFCDLFKEEALQKDICDVFNLFIVKYPECIDMTRIVGVLLMNITKYDYLKYSVIYNIVKRKNYTTISKFRDAFDNMIRIGATLSEEECEDMEGDTLLYSRNILRGHDVSRGLVQDICRSLVVMLGDEWADKLILNSVVNTSLDQERLIFICLALKRSLENVIKMCMGIVGNASGNKYLGVIAFRYLLFSKVYAMVDLEYIKRENVASFLAISYITEQINHETGITIHANLLGYTNIDLGLPYTSTFQSSTDSNDAESKNKTYYSTTDAIGGIEYHNKLITALTEFLKNNIEDELSCLLLQRIVRLDTRVITHEFITFLHSFIEANIKNVNSPIGFSYLFDVLGIIFLNNNDTSFILNLVQTILSEEILETYYSMLYLIATVVMKAPEGLGSLIEIVKQPKMWETKELLLPMTCLTIALSKAGYCTEEQTNYIAKYLMGISQHCSYILMSAVPLKTFFTLGIENKQNIEEIFVLATALKNKGLMEYDLYKNLKDTSISYFKENYITKKNIRRIVRALKEEDQNVAIEILLKNKHNLGKDELLFSAIISFDL